MVAAIILAFAQLATEALKAWQLWFAAQAPDVQRADGEAHKRRLEFWHRVGEWTFSQIQTLPGDAGRSKGRIGLDREDDAIFPPSPRRPYGEMEDGA